MIGWPVPNTPGGGGQWWTPTDPDHKNFPWVPPRSFPRHPCHQELSVHGRLRVIDKKSLWVVEWLHAAEFSHDHSRQVYPSCPEDVSKKSVFLAKPLKSVWTAEAVHPTLTTMGPNRRLILKWYLKQTVSGRSHVMSAWVGRSPPGDAWRRPNVHSSLDYAPGGQDADYSGWTSCLK